MHAQRSPKKSVELFTIQATNSFNDSVPCLPIRSVKVNRSTKLFQSRAESFRSQQRFAFMAMLNGGRRARARCGSDGGNRGKILRRRVGIKRERCTELQNRHVVCV